MSNAPASATIAQGSAGSTEVVPALAGKAIELLAYDFSLDANGTAKWVSGTNEVWTVTIDAEGGTFTTTYAAQTTAAVAYDASAATYQAALEALSTIEVGDITVTKSGDVFTISTKATLGGANLTAPTTTATLLTGGAGTATVATLTGGAATDKTGAQPLLASVPSNQVSNFALLTTAVGDSLRLTSATGKALGRATYRYID